LQHGDEQQSHFDLDGMNDSAASSGRRSQGTLIMNSASGGEPSARRIRKKPTRDFFIYDQQRAFYGPIENSGRDAGSGCAAARSFVTR
jgi:hypothetical protein